MWMRREVHCVNPACGTLNRAPAYSTRRFSNCTKCFWVLPEPSYIAALRRAWHALTRVLAWGYKRRKWLLATAVIALFLVLSWPAIRIALLDALDAPATCDVALRPAHGIYATYGRFTRTIPLTITTASGLDYFVKLETASRTMPVMSFFIHGGLPLETRVPIGTFIVKHAAGKRWCGERALFGQDTATEKGTHDAAFGDGHEYTLRLIPQVRGNFPTARIARREF